MKKLFLASLLSLFPLSAFAVPTKPEQFDKLENEFSLECQKWGGSRIFEDLLKLLFIR